MLWETSNDSSGRSHREAGREVRWFRLKTESGTGVRDGCLKDTIGTEIGRTETEIVTKSRPSVCAAATKTKTTPLTPTTHDLKIYNKYPIKVIGS